MVSERRWTSYAAALSATGEMSAAGNQSSPANRSPLRTPPALTPHRNTSIPAILRSSDGRSDSLDDPLFLHVNENPSAILVNPPLSTTNYNTWSIAMRMALEIKNKWALVDGSIPVPNSDQPNYSSWKRCNLIVSSWILKSLSPSIAQSVMYLKHAKEIWDDLKRRFSQGDPHRISQLQDEIYKLNQGNMSVTDYYTKCRTLWEEMSDMRPLPMCKCSCDLVDIIRKEREEDQVIRFLMGLNEEFSTLKSGVLVIDPLPEVHKVFAMALKVERQLNLANLGLNNLEISTANAIQGSQNTSANEEVVAAVNNFTGKRSFNSINGNVKTAKCTYCGMNGHTVDKCYKKHGYPPGWVPGYKSKGKQYQQGQSAAAVSVNSTPTSLSADQVQKLLSLLHTQGDQHPSTAATVSISPSARLIPDFSSNAEGQSWNDDWFC
ncbi:PREDICTED: uncharacterized protein LOC109193086 isoform X2 [Ipomoea nil]|uniref:uncharacterized protein LOC109193086 isoform X2 n=1 Tax=Ipomoea nil TaxID=35883 RepID=UPI0009017FBA|nr:PREDICTED: uncharacterized protein LOC109193086 isoform X2 [Ipomoea nil]